MLDHSLFQLFMQKHLRQWLMLKLWQYRPQQKRIREKPNALLCAATGNTPIRTYQIIGETFKKDPDIFKKLRILKLDEWGGLDMDHPATCEFLIWKYLLIPLGLNY